MTSSCQEMEGKILGPLINISKNLVHIWGNWKVIGVGTAAFFLKTFRQRCCCYKCTNLGCTNETTICMSWSMLSGRTAGHNMLDKSAIAREGHTASSSGIRALTGWVVGSLKRFLSGEQHNQLCIWIRSCFLTYSCCCEFPDKMI